MGMDLRRKLLVIVGVTLVCTLIAFYAITQGIVLGAFVSLEEKNTQQNMNRFMNLLTEDLTSLDTMVRAWAPRDDTYTFLRDGNLQYIDRNFGPETFTSGRINFMVFLNTSGGIFYAKAFNLTTNQEEPFPGNLAGMVTGNQILRSFLQNNESMSGFLLLPEGPVMVASAPVTTKDYSGVSRGTLIVGRFLDESEIQRVRLLSRRASQVAAGEYGEPLPVTSRDEIGRLTGSFNDMVAGLKERDFIRNTFGRYVDAEVARSCRAGRRRRAAWGARNGKWSSCSPTSGALPHWRRV